MWILLVFLNSCSGVLIEGDIAVPSFSTGGDVRNSFLLNSSQLWSDGIVPYLFETLTLHNGEEEPLFSDDHKQMIRYAMFHISGQVPCIAFREISTGYKGAHLIFSTGGDGDENSDASGCWSYVGCVGAQGGKTGQTINLGSSGCFTMGTVLHEIMHSLGATHEQNRDDRQTYVNVLEDNILEIENRKNFKMKGSLFSSYGTPYDYASIMHYADDAFAVPGTKTIVPRQPNITLIPASQKSKLSPTDTLELAYVYGNLTKQDCHMKDECCPSSGIPAAPRIILLGETGVGKSTMGNRLLGNKPGKCASPNSLLDPSKAVFGVGHVSSSHTNETAWISGKWLGIDSNPCVTILDTPGIGDTQGRDCKHAHQMAQVVREMGDIHTFLLVVKGTENRFTPELRAQLNLYEEIFGRKFWKNLAIEVSFWGHDSRSIERRQGRETDEQKYANQWNLDLSKEFHITSSIPVVFVDPMFGKFTPVDNETEIFYQESSKLWNLVNTHKTYLCDKKACKDSSFTEGIPLLVTDGPLHSKVGGKLAIRWQVWLGDCGNQNGIGSYEVKFTNTLGITTSVFTMTDKQEDPSYHDGFPSNASIEETCSKITKEEVCDKSKSKYKTVTLVFNLIQTNDFGNYSVVNTVGHSKEVEIREVIARSSQYSEWSRWSCKEICYNPYEGHLTREVRTRKCIPGEQENGIDSCKTMTDTWEESQSACPHIKQCPELRSIEVRVCMESWSGTDDNVKIRLKNGLNEECSTDWLDDDGDDFKDGSIQTWNNGKQDFLSSCSKIFRPTTSLHVILELDTHLINCHRNYVKICGVYANFGDGTEVGSSQWRWSSGIYGGKKNTKHYGCYLSYVSENQREEKIMDTSAKTLNNIGWLRMCKSCWTEERKTNKYCCK